MGNECTIRSYWDIEYPYEKRSADEFMPALQRSIARRLRADCKRSVYLSGGIDSATILALSTLELGYALDSYSVQFAVADYDESSIAATIAREFWKSSSRCRSFPERYVDSP